MTVAMFFGKSTSFLNVSGYVDMVRKKLHQKILSFKNVMDIIKPDVFGGPGGLIIVGNHYITVFFKRGHFLVSSGARPNNLNNLSPNIQNTLKTSTNNIFE